MQNKGKKALFIACLLWLATTSNVMAKEPELKKMCITTYNPDSCPGRTTASGLSVRKGIAAVSKSSGHFGDTALIYTEDGYFLGYYECADVLGTGCDNVIDIWVPNSWWTKRIALQTDGKCYVQFIKAEG